MKNWFNTASTAPVSQEPDDRLRKTIHCLIAACAVLMLAGCDDGCDNEVLLQSTSPSGDHRAVVFRRSCGATTGYSTHVSVLPSSRSAINDGGNVLVLEGEHQLALKWVGNEGLRISGPNHVVAFRREATIDGLQISYEALKSAEAPK